MLNFDAVIDQWNVVLDEFRHYDPALAERPCIIVLNKTDTVSDGSTLVDELKAYFSEKKFNVIATSALMGDGIESLINEIVAVVRDNPRPKGSYRLYDIPVDIDSVTAGRPRIIKEDEGVYRVLHPRIEKAVERYDFSQEEAPIRLQRLMRQYRVEELLEDAGAVAGDTVNIGSMSFAFEPERAI